MSDFQIKQNVEISEFLLGDYISDFDTMPSMENFYKYSIVKTSAFHRFLIKLSKLNSSIKTIRLNSRIDEENKNEIEIGYVSFENKYAVSLTNYSIVILYDYSSRDESFQKDLNKLIKRQNITTDEDNYINLLVQTPNGLDLKPFELPKHKIVIEDNYNDDFTEVNDKIVTRLNKKDDKGIILLHGDPGTGKSTYIKYLISIIKKPIIYLPPDLVGALAMPSFVPLLMQYPNSVLIIEDAENALKKRSEHDGQSVSNLLNLSDGLLSECLHIQTICTFNCKVAEIDEALMRKGRMIAKYEFKPLTVENSNKLLNKRGVNHIADEPMTLTDIYNLEENNYNEVKKPVKIGFGR